MEKDKASARQGKMASKRTLGRRLGSGICSFHTGEGLGYPPEQCLDIVAHLRTCLDEHEVVLLGLVLALLCCNLALVVQIRLVAHQHDYDVVATLCPNIVYPLLRVLEGLCICKWCSC